MPNLYLKNCNLVDVAEGEIYEASVFIKDGTIKKICKGMEAGNIPDGDDVEVVDIQGKWIIPGLIDMHVHVKEAFAPLFVSSGITTVRNTGGNVKELRRLLNAPVSEPTPKIFTADRIIDGPPGLWGDTGPWNVNVSSREEAKNEVRRQVEAGADFIKVYGWLSKELMSCVVEEAQKHGKEVSCDLLYSSDVNALEAAEMGIRWNEHASGILQCIYPDWNMGVQKEIWDKIDWHHPEIVKIEQVCLKLKDYNVILCPTMTLFDQQKSFPDYWNPHNSVTSKISENESLIKQWEGISQYKDGVDLVGKQSLMNKLIAITYFKMGGTVVAGTDTPAGIWNYPGMALHRELEILVDIGFSEFEALGAATHVPAKALNREGLGTIAEGAVADMVILNENPIADIRNTKEIHKVVKGGKLYSQSELLNAIPDEEDIEEEYQRFIEEFEASN